MLYEVITLKASNAEDIIEPSVAMAMPEVSKVYYNDAREYGINGLVLPSTGIPVNVPVVSWSVPMTCELRLNAYTNTDVYEVCTFAPDKQIESNDWKIKKGDETLNSNAKGEYADQKYVLYTKIDRNNFV